MIKPSRHKFLNRTRTSILAVAALLVSSLTGRLVPITVDVKPIGTAVKAEADAVKRESDGRLVRHTASERDRRNQTPRMTPTPHSEWKTTTALKFNSAA